MRGVGSQVFGYGLYQRAWRSSRPRDGKAIRALLRQAGCREFTAGHGGFVVQGTSADSTDPLTVACIDERLCRSGEVDRYRAVLTSAGYRVLADVKDDTVLRVWPR